MMVTARPGLRSNTLLVGALMAAACSSAGTAPVDRPDPDAGLAVPADVAAMDVVAPDASVPPPDVPTVAVDVPSSNDAGLACSPPAAPYCATEGCRLAPLVLPTCADGPGQYAVYGDDFCASRATLLVFVAGWCSVCQREARRVEEEVTQPYADRGLRVVNVIAQLPSGMAGTSEFCNTWRNRYGLTSQMTHDPDGRTRSHWPTGTFPVWLLVDHTGRIRYRTQYAAGGIAQLRARIDALLAEP